MVLWDLNRDQVSPTKGIYKLLYLSLAYDIVILYKDSRLATHALIDCSQKVNNSLISLLFYRESCALNE